MKRYTIPFALSMLIFGACHTNTTDTDAGVALSREIVKESASEEATAKPEQSVDLTDGLKLDLDPTLSTASTATDIIAEPSNEPLESVKSDVEDGALASAEEVIINPSVELRRGETLAHFARWSGIPVEEIATASNLELDGSYAVGTEVFLPVSAERFAEIEADREAHRVKRVDGYLTSRGGSEKSDFYTVKTGDTAWSIAKSTQGIPIWVLESYNPAVDLDKLRPGQTLMVPVLADTVVDAE